MNESNANDVSIHIFKMIRSSHMAMIGGRVTMR